MLMQLSKTAMPLNGTGMESRIGGLNSTVRCLICSLLRGQFRSINYYCLRSTWELEALNDGTLRDIGIHRSMIEGHTIARK